MLQATSLRRPAGAILHARCLVYHRDLCWLRWGVFERRASRGSIEAHHVIGAAWREVLIVEHCLLAGRRCLRQNARRWSGHGCRISSMGEGVARRTVPRTVSADSGAKGAAASATRAEWSVPTDVDGSDSIRLASSRAASVARPPMARHMTKAASRALRGLCTSQLSSVSALIAMFECLFSFASRAASRCYSAVLIYWCQGKRSWRPDLAILRCSARANDKVPGVCVF